MPAGWGLLLGRRTQKSSNVGRHESRDLSRVDLSAQCVDGHPDTSPSCAEQLFQVGKALTSRRSRTCVGKQVPGASGDIPEIALVHEAEDIAGVLGDKSPTVIGSGALADLVGLGDDECCCAGHLHLDDAAVHTGFEAGVGQDVAVDGGAFETACTPGGVSGMWRNDAGTSAASTGESVGNHEVNSHLGGHIAELLPAEPRARILASGEAGTGQDGDKRSPRCVRRWTAWAPTTVTASRWATSALRASRSTRRATIVISPSVTPTGRMRDINPSGRGDQPPMTVRRPLEPAPLVVCATPPFPRSRSCRRSPRRPRPEADRDLTGSRWRAG